MIGLNAPADQTLGVFTGVIVLISVGSLIVTVQAKVFVRFEHCQSPANQDYSFWVGGCMYICHPT
jgi:hypothetical protein